MVKLSRSLDVVRRARRAALLVLPLLSACQAGGSASDAPSDPTGSAGSAGSVAGSGESAGSPTTGGGAGDGGSTIGEGGTAGNEDRGGAGGNIASAGKGAGGSTSCTTRIGYGDRWFHGSNHPSNSDSVSFDVTWDGTCEIGATKSTATLSNGWKPVFDGTTGCVMSLDSSCVASKACITRITYGSTWLRAANHPTNYDDVAGHVFWDGSCEANGANSRTTLSNGWGPGFTGAASCQISFQYRNCGGLYVNPVLDASCPDPGVVFDGTQYVAACTSGGAADAFPLLKSSNLVSWSPAGQVFTAASKPTWAKGDFWAPELHRVGARYVAYYTARQKNDELAIGAATADSALGPFVDIGAPIVADPAMGLIDATQFADAGSGTRYLVWKVDGNAVGKPTPIYAQPLDATGTQLTGAKTQLITNDLPWEGGVVEGPFVLRHGTYYYLFYSGNSYANETYALGVARSKNALGPYEKLGTPLIASNATWIGPGHGTVLDLANGTTYVVYHAWKAGHVNGPGDARVLLVDQVFWGSDSWPRVPLAPSVRSRPIP